MCVCVCVFSALIWMISLIFCATYMRIHVYHILFLNRENLPSLCAEKQPEPKSQRLIKLNRTRKKKICVWFWLTTQ